MPKLRIFLADDHGVVRAGLKALVNSEPDMEVVGEAGSGEDALQAPACKPDVVILDISMPGMNGVQAAALLLQAHPALRVLVLSVHEEPVYLRSVLSAGAAGYVLKRSAAETLVLAIRTVAVGGVYLDPALAGRIVETVVGKADGMQPTVELSERETDVLRLIAHGYSNKEIANQLNLSVKTVETYKSRAMQKLGIEGRVAIVQYATRRGWL
ncbi:MAG: response regulator transcription factor [Chloroflexaceae bacterium]|jgi:DNA-binding NarL/FixJ family response regulator|nr:response regulator transcription factor [Chloroflexaceae bacterium]